MGTDNKQLLTMIEKGMNAEEICNKVGFNISTLRRRHHILVMNFRKYIELPGLFEPDNVAELKKGGIVLSSKKLASLDCEFKVGNKFSIAVDKKKITLTVN